MEHLSAPQKVHYDYDVVVVGCGPTGATLANLIAQSGASVLVLDREPDIYNLPRAVHFDDETMRVFQAVGIADDLQRRTRVNPGMRFVDDKGTVLLDWPRPAGIGCQGWHASYRLHQPDLERLLRKKLAQYSNCQLKLGHELLKIEQSDVAVQLEYQDRVSGQSSHCRTKYVVGCDGANSTVRTDLNTEQEDFGFKERWLVVDVLLKQELPALGDHTVQYCSAEQPMTYCRNPGLRRRWEMALPDAMSDEQALNNTGIWSSLSRWVTPQIASMERKAVYTFCSKLSKTWRNKRVLIAGDAAHLTPPFMGQGMCAGIRDAANLAWKLAMVIGNECTDELLNSYEQERRAHVREYIKTAIQLGRLINSLEKESVHSIAASAKNNSLQMASIAPQLGSADLIGQQYRMCTHVGKLFDQMVLSDGTLLDDRCGYRFLLIGRSSAGSVVVKPAGKDALVLSVEDQSALLALLDKWQIEAALIRPDRYVLATTCDVDKIPVLNWQRLLLSANSSARC